MPPQYAISFTKSGEEGISVADLYGDLLRKRVTDLRLKAGISEYQLSLALGQSKGYIQQISSGRALPSMGRFFDLCEYFQVSPGEFFDAENRDPGLTRELMDAARGLGEEQMKLLIDVAKSLPKRSPEPGAPLQD